MKRGVRMFIIMVILLILFQFMAFICQEPSGQLIANQGVFCDSGSQYYCWTSLPFWECRDKVGGYHCTDPVKK
ncbi:MAG: hypothetical protein H5U06_10535 [Candidatus Aminicenantes bacterium]|nr:hypothetical protein [Candidatus Aminicenantes bacterium]